jgi:diguanylate cyclase (GGDEF)-like protein
MKYVDKELKRIQRTGEHFSVAILDMDNFKQINDEHGHLAGDHVLRELTERLRRQMRQSDVLARYGGDEFIMLFPQTSPEQMEAWVRRMYETVARTPIDFHGCSITPLFSLGVSFSRPGMDDIDELLKAADAALYEAKREGGDRYRLAPVSLTAPAQTS